MKQILKGFIYNIVFVLCFNFSKRFLPVEEIKSLLITKTHNSRAMVNNYQTFQKLVQDRGDN